MIPNLSLAFLESSAFWQQLANVASIVSIVAAIPLLVTVFRYIKARWVIANPSSQQLTEILYLQSFMRELEQRNAQYEWEDSLYVPLESELKKARDIIPPEFYVARRIHHGIGIQDYTNLSNAEKIDSSHGTTYKVLGDALRAADSHGVVVIGEPGSGKSVSLRHMALMEAKQALRGRSDKLPVYLNLGTWISVTSDGSPVSFRDFIVNEFGYANYRSSLLHSRLDYYLERRRIVFYLDGLDELRRDPIDQQERLKHLKNFMEAWPDTRFIFACRSLAYPKEFGLQEILIKPFDDSRIRRFFKKALPSSRLYRSLVDQLIQNRPLYELCQNPFYLNLLALYIRHNQFLPTNTAQLFQFFLSQFLQRELSRDPKGSASSPEAFELVHSTLAHYMSVREQTTTVDYDQFLSSLPVYQRDLFDRAVRFSIEGGLLEINIASNALRFSHYRFQEYFTALGLIDILRYNPTQLPPNFFTNLWWRDTILLLAGIDPEPSYLVTLILNVRSSYENDSDLFSRLLNIDLLVLAFDCARFALSFINTNLLGSMRDELITVLSTGSPLEKVKIIRALMYDQHDLTYAAIKANVDDESIWVSETAFFALSNQTFRLGGDYATILREFWRFLLDGRLPMMLVPMVRHMGKSKKLKNLFPVYVLLSFINIGCLFIIAYMYIYIAWFLAFRLEYGFTSRCIGCMALASGISYGIGSMVFGGKLGLLGNSIRTAPVALLALLMIESPVNLWERFIGVAVVGLVLYSPLGDKIKIDSWQEWVKKCFLFAISAHSLSLVLYYTRQLLRSDLTMPELKGGLIGEVTTIGRQLTEVIKELIPGQMTTAAEGEEPTGGVIDIGRQLMRMLEDSGELLLLAGSAILLLSSAWLIVRAILAELRDWRSIIGGLAEISRMTLDNEEDVAKVVTGVCEQIDRVWGKQLIVRALRDRLQNDYTRRLSIWARIGEITDDLKLKDLIYQLMENDERAWQRRIGWPVSTTTDDESHELRGEPSLGGLATVYPWLGRVNSRLVLQALGLCLAIAVIGGLLLPMLAERIWPSTVEDVRAASIEGDKEYANGDKVEALKKYRHALRLSEKVLRGNTVLQPEELGYLHLLRGGINWNIAAVLTRKGEADYTVALEASAVSYRESIRHVEDNRAIRGFLKACAFAASEYAIRVDVDNMFERYELCLRWLSELNTEGDDVVEYLLVVRGALDWAEQKGLSDLQLEWANRLRTEIKSLN